MTNPLDLKEFEKKVHLRPLRVEDYPRVIEIQSKSFPGMKTWMPEQFESQIRMFPEGQLGIEVDGKLVASTSNLIVDFSQYSAWHDWKEISDNGFIRNHDPEGDTLYGIEIMVDPEYRGLKLARRLYEARKQIVRERNLFRIIAGGRVPGYGKHAPGMSASEYVKKVISKELYDPVLTTQISNGFVLKGLIPNYLPGDKESCGYATFLEWRNPDYVVDPRKRLVLTHPVRLCVVQYEMRKITSFEEFGTQCEYFVDVASDKKADFVLFPELLTMQLLSCMPTQRPGLAARTLAELTPKYLELFTQLAIKYNINIVGGSQFTMENEKLYNAAYLFRRDGTLARQNKLHITPNERRWWGVSPGSELEVFDTDRGKVAILICYDVEFPELARVAAHKGAQILFVPFNTDDRDGYLRIRYCAQARCVENHVYAAMAGCVGNLPFVENADVHYAQSGVLSPSDVSFARDGIVAESTPNIETVILHDIDLELLKTHRRSGSVLNWKDRRVDLYRIRYGKGDRSIEV